MTCLPTNDSTGQSSMPGENGRVHDSVRFRKARTLPSTSDHLKSCSPPSTSDLGKSYTLPSTSLIRKTSHETTYIQPVESPSGAYHNKSHALGSCRAAPASWPWPFEKKRTLSSTSSLWKILPVRTKEIARIRNLCGSSSSMTHTQAPSSSIHINSTRPFGPSSHPGISSATIQLILAENYNKLIVP